MFRNFVAAVLAAFAFNAFAAVDANGASRAELESVKGIGPGLSAKILKAREAGAFKDWADMVQRVPGVGTGNAGKLSQAGLTVAGAPFDAKAMPAPKARERKAESTGAAGTSSTGDKAAPAKKPAKKAEASERS